MNALRLKSMSSPDVEIDVWEPGPDGAVYFLLELEIGEVGSDGADLFQVVVATPEGLRKDTTDVILSERAMVIVSVFSWQVVKRCIQSIIARCAGRDWSESALKLQRYFQWEYEDYVQDNALKIITRNDQTRE